MSDIGRGARQGLLASVPIAVGYVPIAITFGALAASYGLPVWVPILFSTLIFAGGTQFILLGALQSGTPWPYVVALCALIDARHLLYGPLMRGIFPRRLIRRIGLAFGLTDEIFATALSRRHEPSSAALTAWLGSLTWVSYLAWAVGTAVGALVGHWLEKNMPATIHSLHFALPALFLCLTLQNCSRRTAMPVMAAVVAAVLGLLLCNQGVAIIAAVCCGALCATLGGRKR